MRLANILFPSSVTFTLLVGSAFVNREPEVSVNYKSASTYQTYKFVDDKPNFCGELVPLDRKNVLSKYSNQINTCTHYRSNTELLIRRSKKWFPTIEKILVENDVPEDFKYLALVESYMSNVTSPRGAAGFWQFMPSASDYFGLRVDTAIDQRFDPIESTKAACRYFKTSYKRLGSWTNVAASYNMGVWGMKRKIRSEGTSDYYSLNLNQETGWYVYKIAALKEILEHPTKYGFENVQIYDSEDINTTAVTVNKSIHSLYSFAREHNTSVKVLKELNPWIKANYLPVANGEQYVLQMPADLSDYKKEQELEYYMTADIDSVVRSKSVFASLSEF